MKEFTLYLLSDAVQMCLQNYGYTAIPLKVRAPCSGSCCFYGLRVSC